MFLKRLCCSSRSQDHLNMDLRLLIIVFLIKWSYAQGSHPPRITEHPIDTTVPRHDPATLNCKAEGSPTPTIQWYKDGVPLKILPGSHRIALPAGGLFFLKVVNSRRESDAGIYWCEAKNELGVARSRNASLQVAVLRDEFRLEPQNTRIAQGDTALLECAAPRGVPEPTVTWKKGGQKLDLEASKRIRVVDGGNLAIQDARQSDEGQYQCIAKNPVGVRESAVAMLKVNVKPFIIRGPYDQTVLEGSSVTFPCRVGGDPMPDVLWLRTASGGNMPLDRVSVLEDRSLRLERVTVADEGEYNCEADNAVGAISAMGTLTVFAPPKFVQRPTSKSVELGADTSLECRANGNPRPTIIWTIKNNRSLIIPGAPPLDRLQSINSEDGHSILTLTKFQRSDKDLVLICNAINEVGTITARAQLTLDSQEDRPPPIIIAGPVNQTLPVKSLATLQCKAIGLPNPTISWYRDGIPVHPTVKVNITSAGDLIISDLDRKQDQGLYTCVASSRTGKSTWSGYLRIEVPTNPNIKFYRAPDPTKYPTAPGQPRLLNASSTALTLVWASSDKIGAAPLLGYAVEMFSTNKSKTWIPLAARLNDPIFTVDALTPGAAYMFIVRAENSYGFSPPSAISELILAGRPLGGGVGSNGRLTEDERDPLLGEVESLLSTNDVVELLEANATDATTVRLGWDIDSGQYIEGFYIYARELHRAEYKLMTVLNAADSGGPSACAVQGLQKATMYEFFLVPFYKNVVGKPSNAKYARTMEDVPEAAPHNMEAIQFNKTSVFLKWQPPQPNRTRNGVLTSYNVIVTGLDSHNTTRIYKNMTIDAVTPTLLLANLTSGVTYYIAVAAATKVGIGPFSQPAVLRMDPRTQSLDTGFTRYPINRDIADDFLTQTWFIILLGSIIAIIVFLFGALVLFKRYQFIKQTSLGSLHGNHAIGSVRKFPTLPLNTNGVWIDPTGGVWRQATTCTTKEPLPDYSQITGQQTLALPDYERLTPLNMPDYAEVACSTFKNPHGPPKTSPNKSGNALQTSGGSALYDSFGAYATTNLVANAKLYQHRYAATATSTKTATTKWLPQHSNNNNSSSTTTDNSNNNKQLQHDDYRAAGMYSAPPSAYYAAGSIGGGGGGGGGTYFSAMDTVYPALMPLQQDKMTVSTASTAILASPAKSGLKNNTAGGGGSKINITENKMEHLSNMAGGNTNNCTPTKATSGSSVDLPARYNPFNGASATTASASVSASASATATAAARQQLLTASHALKQGLGAYANTTLAAQMCNGGGVGTLRRQRNPKVCKSENNINFGNLYSSNNPSPAAGAGNKATAVGDNSSIGQPDFLTGGPSNDNGDDFSSTNHLLNDWASSSSIAADQHFGSKQPNKQHLYVKSKDGTWSAVPSDAYQNFKQQQQQQQHQLLGAGEPNQSTKSNAETKSTLNPTHLNSSLNSSSSVSSSSHSFNSSFGVGTGNVAAVAQASNKFFSSYGQSDHV